MILITGSAGFIGFHLCKRMLDENHKVIGIDNLNSYYDVSLKNARLDVLKEKSNFEFKKIDFCDYSTLESLFQEHSITEIIHLGAQAGVRYSIEAPNVYAESNLTGFLNVLEVARQYGIRHLIYASSSSVYGANTKQPFSENDPVDHPISLYAATKRSNELMAHTYSHLYSLPTTGLRFFTVYGPWGRPDMALFKFTKAILERRPIEVFNNGDMKRAFTSVDDVVEGILRILQLPPEASESNPSSLTKNMKLFRIYNLGDENSVNIMDLIHVLEKNLGKKAKIRFKPMQPGDVRETVPDMSHFRSLTGFAPHTPIDKGVESFVRWYTKFYGQNDESLEAQNAFFEDTSTSS